MKLKRHREDVRLLRDSWASHGGSPVFVDIAKRYLNLIRAVEYGLNKNKITSEEIEEHGGKDLKRVIKDAEK